MCIIKNRLLFLTVEVLFVNKEFQIQGFRPHHPFNRRQLLHFSSKPSY